MKLRCFVLGSGILVLLNVTQAAVFLPLSQSREFHGSASAGYASAPPEDADSFDYISPGFGNFDHNDTALAEFGATASGDAHGFMKSGPLVAATQIGLSTLINAIAAGGQDGLGFTEGLAMVRSDLSIAFQVDEDTAIRVWGGSDIDEVGTGTGSATASLTGNGSVIWEMAPNTDFDELRELHPGIEYRLHATASAQVIASPFATYGGDALVINEVFIELMPIPEPSLISFLSGCALISLAVWRREPPARRRVDEVGDGRVGADPGDGGTAGKSVGPASGSRPEVDHGGFRERRLVAWLTIPTDHQGSVSFEVRGNQCLMVKECIAPDSGNAPGNRHGDQFGAPGERPVLDAGDALAKGDVGEAAATGEGLQPNTGDTVTDFDSGESATVQEGPRPDVLDRGSIDCPGDDDRPPDRTSAHHAVAAVRVPVAVHSFGSHQIRGPHPIES